MGEQEAKVPSLRQHQRLIQTTFSSTVHFLMCYSVFASSSLFFFFFCSLQISASPEFNDTTKGKGIKKAFADMR